MNPFHAGRLVVSGGLLVLLAVWVMAQEALSVEVAVGGTLVLLAIIALLLGVDIRRSHRHDDDDKEG